MGKRFREEDICGGNNGWGVEDESQGLVERDSVGPRGALNCSEGKVPVFRRLRDGLSDYRHPAANQPDALTKIGHVLSALYELDPPLH